MKKIEKMVKAYNEYATKHGYSTIAINYENNTIDGEFIPKDETLYTGFYGYFKNLKTTYHNGYLKGDFDEIISEIKKLAN